CLSASSARVVWTKQTNTKLVTKTAATVGFLLEQILIIVAYVWKVDRYVSELTPCASLAFRCCRQNTATACCADKNVVNAREKVANGLNHGTTSAQLSGLPRSSNNLSL